MISLSNLTPLRGAADLRNCLSRFGKCESGGVSQEFVLVAAVVAALAVGTYAMTRDGTDLSNDAAMTRIEEEGPDFEKLFGNQQKVKEEFE